MNTSIIEKENHLAGTPDIFQSPAVYKTPDKIREQWDKYLKDRINEHKMPTKAGVCFALKIHRKEWHVLKTHPILGVAIDWIETVIEDTWLQELVSAGHSAGALAYLKSHYPEQYGEVEPLSRNINMVFNVEQLNLIARRIVADSKQSEGTPDRLRDSNEFEIRS